MTRPAISQPKRVLLDENIDERLRYHLAGHGFDVETVRCAGFQTYKNGRLLRAADGDFDVFLTLDRSIEYQNNLKGLRISVLVVRSQSTRLAHILVYLDDIIRAIQGIRPSEVIYLG